MTATRSPIVIASVWSCVTYSVVVPSSWCSRAMYARISTRSLASRFESGSSMRKACGWRTIARPSATRWRWPPDSARGRRASRSPMPSRRATAPARVAREAAGAPCIFSANPMLSATLMCG